MAIIRQADPLDVIGEILQPDAAEKLGRALIRSAEEARLVLEPPTDTPPTPSQEER